MTAARPASPWGGPGRAVATFALVSLTVVGLVVVALRWPNPQPIVLATSVAATAPPFVSVSVGGGVRYPGVYQVPSGATVADAVATAGGPLAGARWEPVRSAEPLVDGAVVCVPRGSTALVDAAVDINRASASELEALPGIGPTLAQRILDHREAHGPFSTIEELMNVQGIGERTLDALRGLVAVR